MKVLNLYAGLGGNRKLWPSECEVTAVELDADIAAAYKENFPQDQVIVGDAHQYLLEHFEEFDFIWASPPCPSHSRIRFMASNRGSYGRVYPEMSLYQEIIFLKHSFKGKWIVENVIPYYEPLIKPTAIRGRHMIWANFHIPTAACVNKADQPVKQVTSSSERFGFSVADKKMTQRKDKILRNLVDPELGKFIFEAAFKKKQLTLRTE